MIKTIEITFYEPWTGIWVRGRNEYRFKDEKDLHDTCDRWAKAIKEIHHSAEVEVKPIDGWSKV